MSIATMVEYTPSEIAILRVLSDGQPHTLDELHATFANQLSEKSGVRKHVWSIRKKLRQEGMTIACVFDKGRYYYQHFRYLASPNNGRT